MKALYYISLALVFVAAIIFLTLAYFQYTLEMSYKITGVKLNNFDLKDFLFSKTPVIIDIETKIKHKSYISITLKNVQFGVKYKGEVIAVTKPFNLPLKPYKDNIIKTEALVFVSSKQSDLVVELIQAYQNKQQVSFVIDMKFKFLIFNFEKRGYSFKTYLS